MEGHAYKEGAIISNSPVHGSKSTGHHTEQQRLPRKKVNMPDFTDYDSEEKVFQEPSLGDNSVCAIERNSILADVTGDCRNSNKVTLEGTSDSNNFCSGVTEDCSRSNLVVPNVSQFNETPLSHADQIFTSFDSSLGATCAATVNKNLSSDIVPVEKGRLPEKFDKDSVILEEFENHNCLKSMKRRSDTMSDFTEYCSRKKVHEKSSFDDNFVGAIERNVAVVDVTGDYSDSNNKTLETNSSSNNLSGGYITENCQRFNRVITVDCQTSNLSQADEAPSSEVDQAFTSSDSSSEAAHTSAGNKHLSNNVASDQTNKLTENLDKRSINLEDFEYFNDFKSLKKRRDCLPEYASGKETCEEVFLGDNLVVELERNNNLADVTDDYPGSNKMALEVKSTANTLSSGVTEHCRQSNLMIIEDCQKPNLPQSEKTRLIQVDQIVTTSDSSSEAITDMVFVANDKLVENLDKETVACEKFENHDVLKGTKRRFDGLSDFTKYGSGKKMCQESSMGNNLMGAIETNSTLVDATDNYHDSNKITLEANLIPDNINSGVTEDFQRSNLVITNDCQRTGLSQFDEAFLSQIDQAVTSSDCSSEAAPAASVNKHPSSDIIQVEKAKCHGNLNTESILLELFDNPRNLKSNKRRRDCMSDFTEHGLWKKFCQEPSLGDKLVGAVGRKSTLVNTVSDPDCKMMMLEVTSSSLNGGMEGLSAFTATMQTNIIDEAASESYLNDGHSIIVDVAGKVMADNPSFYSEISGQHVIGSMPLLTECCNDENFENAAQETVEATVSEKLDFTMLEESPGCTTFSSAMSVEINPKIPYANFKGDSSLPPSPITGVIDCFIGKSNGHDLHSVSLNEEDTSFSFHPPNKTFGKEIPRNEIGFDIQGTLGRFADSHECSQNLSIGIYGDRQSEQKERAAFASCSTSEGDNPISEGKNTEVQIIDSIPLEISLRRHPRKKLIVLDLNGLLCDIVNDYYPSGRVEKKVGGKPIFKRPFCDDFMKFCFNNFHIGIWSSRRKYNVDGALDYLMGEFKQQLLFCWDQSKCTYTGARTIENHHKPLVLKELKKLWNKEEPDLPWEEGEFTPSNTLLLDDSPYKALCNPRYTAIFPRPYKYTDEGDESLGPGGDIRVYLENLLASDDIRDFIKEHPFGQLPITESDRHWDFYHRIIRNNSAIHYNA